MVKARVVKTGAASWEKTIDNFITHLEDTERSAHTTHHYRDDLMAFNKWYLSLGPDPGRLDPGQITDEVLRQWKRHLRDQVLTEKTGRTYKRKPASINAKLAAMRSFLRWASYTGLVKTMPETPRRERIGRHTVKSLDRKEQNRLLRVAAESYARRDHPLVVVLLELGLRVAELVALVWSDVHLTDRKGTFTVREGKGRKPRGPFRMSADAVSAFKTLRGLDPQAGPSDQVFRSQRKSRKGRKTPLTIRGVQNLIGRLAQRAGLPGLSPHWMRHTCALNMFKRLEGNPRAAVIVRDYLGHSDVATTLNHYASSSERDFEQAVGALTD